MSRSKLRSCRRANCGMCRWWKRHGNSVAARPVTDRRALQAPSVAEAQERCWCCNDVFTRGCGDCDMDDYDDDWFTKEDIDLYALPPLRVTLREAA